MLIVFFFCLSLPGLRTFVLAQPGNPTGQQIGPCQQAGEQTECVQMCVNVCFGESIFTDGKVYYQRDAELRNAGMVMFRENEVFG